jgi:hypothetical membrane protein
LSARLAGVLGLAGILAAAAGLACSAAMYPGFSLWDDNLSVLGVSAGAPFFNGGLVLCGVLGALNALGIFVHLSQGRPLRRAGAALLALAMAFLAAIGIITEAFVMVHFYIAVAFFSLFAAASLVLGISFIRDADFRAVGWLAILSSGSGVLAWLLPGEGWAISEIAASVPGILWLGLLAFRMARSKPA